MSFCNTRPCSNCPFRTDIDFYLPVSRVREIVRSLENDKSFACHKTTEFDDEGEVLHGKKTQHCAGAAIMLEHMESPNQMMRIMERVGGYDMRKMEMDSPVFTSGEEMIKEYRRRNRK